MALGDRSAYNRPNLPSCSFCSYICVCPYRINLIICGFEFLHKWDRLCCTLLYQPTLCFQSFVVLIHESYKIFHCANTPQISHSSVVKCLSGFHFFAVSNSATVTIFGHVPLHPCVTFSWKDVEGDTLACRILDLLVRSALSLLVPRALGPGALQGPYCPQALRCSWQVLVASCPWPCTEALAGRTVELAAGMWQLVLDRGLGLGLCVG